MAVVHKCIHHLQEGVENGCYRHQIFRIHERAGTKWQPPPQGYVRVDVDGSRTNRGEAACGGVIRDYMGNWVYGFQQKLGYMTSTAAEIQAIHNGLQICAHLGLTKIMLYSDSTEAIQLLLVDCDLDHPLYQEVVELRSLIHSTWDLEILHCHREGIQCADFLARTAHSNMTANVTLLTPPETCLVLLGEDRGTTSMPHTSLN